MDLSLKSTPSQKEGIVSKEGAAHFFLGPQSEHFCHFMLRKVEWNTKKQTVPKIIQLKKHF